MFLEIIWILSLVVAVTGAYILLRLIGFKSGEALHVRYDTGASENFGVDAAVKHLSRLFENAQHEILIVSDDLGPDCWSDQNVVSRLSKAVMEGTAHGRIVVGPKFDLNRVQGLKSAINSGLLKVRKLNYRPNGHFVVVDSLSVRLEEPHEPGSTELKAQTFWDAPMIARKMRKHFEELWEQGEEYRDG